MNRKGKIAVTIAAFTLFSSGIVPVSIKAASSSVIKTSKSHRIDKGLANISNSSSHLINNGLADISNNHNLLPDIVNPLDANLPDLSIEANGGQLLTKQGAFEVKITMKTNPVKTGTKLVLHIDPKAVQYNTLKVSNNLPVWLTGPSIDEASGTVTFTVNRDINQDGTGAIDLTGVVNEVGEYDVTAQTVSPDNSAIDEPVGNGHYVIINPGSTDDILTGYWNPNPNVDLPSGDELENPDQGLGFASGIGQAAGVNNRTYDWLNDGNVVGMYADWNNSLAYGVDPAYGQLKLNIHGDEAEKALIRLDDGFPTPVVKVMEYPSDGSPSKDITEKFDSNIGWKKENEITISLKGEGEGLPASSRYRFFFYFVEPDTSPDKVYHMSMDMTWGTWQEPNGTPTVSLANRYVPRNNSTKFIPRIYGPKDTVNVKNGSEVDLDHPENIIPPDGLPANDIPMTAHDVEDGDLTGDKIHVIDRGGFDANKEGDYVVTYAVEDSDGNQVTYKVTYHVGPSDKIAQPITIHYQDTEGNKLADDTTIKGDLGNEFDISTDEYTKASTLPNYSLDLSKSTLPTDTKHVAITEDTQEYTYVYDGKLIFKSAPKELVFGIRDLSVKDYIYDLESKDADLEVADYRGVSAKPNWQLNGEITEDFTGKNTGSEMTGILDYFDGTADKIMSKGQPILISSHDKSTKEDIETNVSKDWSITGDAKEDKPDVEKSKGLKLKVKGGQARADEYSATVKWTLSDGVANKN